MINTGVPNSLNRPQTFHTFTYLRASGSLVSVPLKVALIGAKSSAGTATAGVVYEATDAATTDGLFGVGSELALMCRKAYECATLFGRGPRVFAVSVAESAGVANVQTIAVTGTATTDGNAIIRVAGRLFIVGIRNGDVANTVAAKITTTLQANTQNLPVVVANPGAPSANVTLTHATKGVNGADVKVSIDQTVAGIALACTTTTPGTLATDHQTALDALSPLRYDGIAFANHAAADITEINTDITTRWSATSKAWGWYFVGEMGSIGTATGLAAAANHQAVVIASFEGCLDTAGEMATATAMLVFSRERPNANYDGARVPLHPPAAGTIYTSAEVETAIAAGLTPFGAVIDSTGAITQNLAKCERLVTTRTTTSSQPDDRNRDIGVSRTGVALAIQIDIAYAERFGGDANPDGTLQTEDTDGQIKDMASAILRAEAALNVIAPSKVESDIAQMVVEHDAITAGRDNVAIFYHVVNGLHQVAWQHNVQLGV